MREPADAGRTRFDQSRHDDDAVCVGVHWVSTESYLSAGRWLSALISWRKSTASFGRHSARQSGLHGFQLRGPAAQFLLPIEKFQRLLLDDLHAPLDVLLRFVGLGPDVEDRRLRLGEEGFLSPDILFARCEFLVPAREFVFPFVGLCLAVSHSFLPVQEFDRPSLKELPFAGELSLLPFHHLPNILRL